MKTDLFQSCGHCGVFQICWHSEWSTFTASSFSIWNSLTGIPLLFWWSNGCWQFDLCFLWLFKIQLEHLEVHVSHTVETWLGEFWALLCYHVRWVQLCGSLSILWHCLFWGLEWKLTFSSPVAIVELSKFAGILSAALSQHYLLGFEVAQLEFHRLHQVCL